MTVERKWTWKHHAEYWHRYDPEAGYWTGAVYRPHVDAPLKWVWAKRAASRSPRLQPPKGAVNHK